MQIERLVPGLALVLACGACSKPPPPEAAPAPPIEVPLSIRVEGVPAEELALLPPIDPQRRGATLAAYVELSARLDANAFLEGYPEIARRLRTGTRFEVLDAVRMCGASRDLRAIPLLVRELGRPDRELQVAAGLALGELVDAHELERRDPAYPGEVRLLPRKEGEPDLRGLHWVIEELLRSGEANLQSYAATMAGYLGLEALAPLLEALRGSRQPAVTTAAANALRQLELGRPR